DMSQSLYDHDDGVNYIMVHSRPVASMRAGGRHGRVSCCAKRLGWRRRACGLPGGLAGLGAELDLAAALEWPGRRAQLQRIVGRPGRVREQVDRRQLVAV